MTPINRSVVLGASLLLATAGIAHAQDVYYSSNATLNSFVNGSVYVGYANEADRLAQINGTNPTVTLNGGASVRRNLNSYNSSLVSINGGNIVQDVNAFDSSRIDMNAGGTVVGNVVANNSSTFNISGSSFLQSLYGNDDSLFNFVGSGFQSGSVAGITGYNGFQITGTLAGGNQFNNVVYLEIGSNARFIFTPAPSSAWVLLGGALPGVMVCLKRRRK